MNKELSILSDILKVNVEFLTQIRGVLDVTKVRRMLIEKEYQDNVREKKYPKKQIIAALMVKYGLSQSGIEQIIYAKVSNKEKHCTKCGAAMSKYKWTHNSGVCDTCIQKEIKQNGNKE